MDPNDKNKNTDKLFSLKANNNALKFELTSVYGIDLRSENSIAPLLGFESEFLRGGQTYESTKRVTITGIRIIRVDCNITSGAYGDEAHTLFEFDVDVEPGFKLTKEPKNIIYMPIRPQGRQLIDTITLRILDDNGGLIYFRGEKIKLELRPL